MNPEPANLSSCYLDMIRQYLNNSRRFSHHQGAIAIRQSEAGFTLVEVLVTLVVFGVLAASVLSLFKESSVKQRHVMHKVVALNFAQAGMEGVFADKFSLGFDALKTNRYTTDRFNGVMRVIHIDSLSQNMKKVCVMVEWFDQRDSLVALVGRYQGI
ncbi:MAG: prepilin-type N-terminal cleavage/methylation domain-containing protein [Candidatus Zhuqueibacterota bacterium]